jgi:NADH-quinone oxidoreductase subunit H
MDLFGLIEALIKVAVVAGGLLLTVAYMSLVERRVSGFIQLRLGPNRVGPFGLFQPLADGLKFLMKEDIVPGEVHRPTYVLAPAVSLALAMSAFAVIPFGGTLTLAGREVSLVIADLDVGVLLALAATSLGVYGIIMGGWSSNNKFSLFGGLRASAQMISYELSLGLAVVGVIVFSGTLNLSEIVEQQAAGLWNVAVMPLGFLIFLIAGFAETNRLPFDMPEAESELVAGYHTEYSSMKFSMFYMAEYTNMTTSAALLVTLFLGGYSVPAWIAGPLGLTGTLLLVAQILAFALKVGFFLVFFVWVRWTLPRFRYDQLMRVGWKVLLPLSLLNVVLVGALVVLIEVMR